MPEIDVHCRPIAAGWVCDVTIREGVSSSAHTVTVATEDLARLVPGATDPTELVRVSFIFLLERESKESILRAFDLPVIERYFPGYGASIRSRIIRPDV